MEEVPPLFTQEGAEQNLPLNSEELWCLYFQRLNLSVCTGYSYQRAISCCGLV